MSLVPLRPLLEATNKYGFAQGAFNINMIAQAQAAIEAHEILRSPAILQGADLANAFMGGKADFINGTVEDKKIGAKRIADAVKGFAGNSNIPVVMHLDHGKDFDSVKAAVDGGYTSVMIDGSYLPFDKNIELTREVVKYAHERGVSVEGELGVLAGVEDDVFAQNSTYTNPMKVVEFFKKTGVDCLAISYGTSHGAIKGANVKLRKEIVIASMENLKHEGIFGVLVSHGSSSVPRYIVDQINELGGNITNANGIPIDQVRSVIPYGIGKVNVDTDVRLAVTRNIREYFYNNPLKKKSSTIGTIWKLMEQKPEQFDPRYYITPVMDILITGQETKDGDLLDIIECIKKGVKEIVGTLVVQFGSLGYASKVEIVTLEQMAERYKKAGI